MKCSPQKVLFLSAADNIGGMERIVCGLSRQFVLKGWDVRTVFPKTTKSEALLRWCCTQGVEAEANPAMLDVAAVHSHHDMQALRRLVKTAQPTFVNLHYGSNFISFKDVLAVRMAGQRNCIASVHSVTSWEMLGLQKQKMTRLASYFCRAVVANSEATRRVLLEAGISPQKAIRIPCGVREPSSLPELTEARRALHLPADAFMVSCAARLVSGKKVEDLIEAASRIPDPQANLLLAIAGDGPERAALEALSATRMKGRVVFLGQLSNMNDFYAASDLFVLPSAMEGFGLVYIEAAFHGVPSIGTNVGGIPEAVEDGKTGLLVSVGDIPALSAAIQRLREDSELRRTLGEAAKSRAYAEFTEAAMAERYNEIFTRTLSCPRDAV